MTGQATRNWRSNCNSRVCVVDFCTKHGSHGLVATVHVDPVRAELLELGRGCHCRFSSRCTRLWWSADSIVSYSWCHVVDAQNLV